MIEASKKAEEILQERGAYLFGILEIMEQDAITFQKTWMVNKIGRIRKKINIYYKQLRCLTYNGSSYDLVALIREGLCYYIKQHDSMPIAIKASNRYILLTSERLRFLDVILFCGNKTSLRNFLHTWLTHSQLPKVGSKLYFPYSALNSSEDLIREALPPYEEFESDLSCQNMLEEDFSKFQKLVEVGLSEEEAIIELKLPERPKTGREIYENLQKIWDENECKYLYQFLIDLQ